MFTGIIEEVGKVKQIFSNSIVISAKKVLSDVKLGDSIAVNGVCLTVVKYSEAEFEVDVMPDPFRCSNLGKLKSGSEVNLERAMSANGRFGGHIVSGHIDCCGIINNMTKEDNAVIVEISPQKDILKNIVNKGSIAIDGISLTVAYVKPNCFAVSIIPHTGKETILLKKHKMDTVNLECDVIGKYVENFVKYYGVKDIANQDKVDDTNKNNITTDFLKNNGFY